MIARSVDAVRWRGVVVAYVHRAGLAGATLRVRLTPSRGPIKMAPRVSGVRCSKDKHSDHGHLVENGRHNNLLLLFFDGET
jgi:hypothetical protein